MCDAQAWLSGGKCCQQECIPVECVATAAVAATRCQYQEWGVWCHSLSGSIFLPRGVSLQRGASLQGGSVDKHLWKYYLPFLAVGKNPNLPQSRIWNSGELRKVTVPLDMSLNIEIYLRFLIFRRLLHRLLSPQAVLELSGRDSRRVRLPPCKNHWYCKGLFTRSPSPCSSKAPSKFNIVPIVADFGGHNGTHSVPQKDPRYCSQRRSTWRFV